jgi:hypothetical protein
MVSRALAILVASWLPAAALIAPLGRAHTINAIVAGTIATLLAAIGLGYDRPRFGAAAIGAWVALSAFVFRSTLLEEVIVISWGTMMFALMAGPFSAGRRWPAAVVAPRPARARRPAQVHLPVTA